MPFKKLIYLSQFFNLTQGSTCVKPRDHEFIISWSSSGELNRLGTYLLWFISFLNLTQGNTCVKPGDHEFIISWSSSEELNRLSTYLKT